MIYGEALNNNPSAAVDTVGSAPVTKYAPKDD